MATFQCKVVSVNGDLYSGEVSMLVAEGLDGQLGILAGHTPLITLLKPGTMKIQTVSGESEYIYISGGVLEVQPKIVTVLADIAVRASNLSEAKIAEKRREVEQMLENQQGTVDTAAALAALTETFKAVQDMQKFKNRA